MQSSDFEAKKNSTNRLEEIKYLLKRGELTREEAVREAELPLKMLNKEMRRISRMYGFHHRKVTFTQYMR